MTKITLTQAQQFLIKTKKMTKITLTQAQQFFKQGLQIWIPINCECCTDEQHYTYLGSSQGDTVEDLKGKELYI